MSTPPNFSNFISNFTDLSNIDIVSSVSGQFPLVSNPPTTIEITGRYFFIGNLLIQFSSNTISNQTTGSYTIPFPISYDTTPYTVMLTATRDDNSPVIVVLKSFNTTSFEFAISDNGGWCTFIAIGPRPSTL